jgi:ribonuclease HI
VILTQYSGEIGKFVTNNIAEYQALIKALELASNFTDDELTCFLDSELVVKQLLGEYKVKDPKLLPLFLKVQKLQEHFKKIKYQHVSRWDKFQQVVDELLNNEMDKKFGKRKRFYK